ncbi:hypothetical protein [Cecembia rubra]|uniref:Uncharacterized protein n=1 Tax=Cecembia rubra TaxID=1485585 RepID=A0A2P8EAN1_9BACT|nr:hypothetical protein [Cecembia rubra]PSL06533.1 hypothetical protein CLV48_102350 [Cecembia rubra]
MSLLKKTHSSNNHKFTYPDAVFRVNNFRPEQNPINGFRIIQIEMSVFASQQSLSDGGQPIDTVYESVQVEESVLQSFVGDLLNNLTEKENYQDGTVI